MIDYHVVIEWFSELFYGNTIYTVKVDGTDVHRSRSYKKADATYEAEVAFGSMFSKSTSVIFSKTEDGGLPEYVKVAVCSKSLKEL